MDMGNADIAWSKYLSMQSFVMNKSFLSAHYNEASLRLSLLLPSQQVLYSRQRGQTFI